MKESYKNGLALVLVFALQALLYPFFFHPYPNYLQEVFSKDFLFVHPKFLIALSTALVLQAVLYKFKSVSYQPIKYVYFIPAAILTWWLLSTPYNFVLQDWYLSDRIIILLLLLLSWRFPIALLPWVVLFNLFANQYQIPFGGFKVLDKLLPLAIIQISICSYLIISILNRIEFQIDQKKTQLAALLLILISFYFLPGFDKLTISTSYLDWIGHNKLENNVMAMHSRGWLNGSEWTQIIYNFILTCSHYFNYIILSFVLLVELLAPLLVVNLLFYRWLSIGFVTMHILIFSANGALFLSWIVVDILLFIALSHQFFTNSFKWILLILMVPTVLFKDHLFYLPKLAWFDTAWDNRLEIEVKQNNHWHKLSEKELEPYALNWMYGNMMHMVPYKTHIPGFIHPDKMVNVYRQNNLQVDDYKLFVDDNFQLNYEENVNLKLETFFNNWYQMDTDVMQINQYLDVLSPPDYWNAHWFSKNREINKENMDSLAIYYIEEIQQYPKTVCVRKRLIHKIKFNK